MTARSVLRWTPLGFGVQILFIVLFDFFVGLAKISETGYGPWMSLGASAVPFGPQGLAMPLGPMFGLLFGMFVYSIVVGAVISLIRQPRYK